MSSTTSTCYSTTDSEYVPTLVDADDDDCTTTTISSSSSSSTILIKEIKIDNVSDDISITEISEEDLDRMGLEEFLDGFEVAEMVIPEHLVSTFDQVRDHIESELPTITKILEADIEMKRKAYLVELYEVFLTTEPSSLEYTDLKIEITELLKAAIKESEDDKKISEETQAKIKELKDFQIQEETMESRIACINIPIEYRHAIYSKYTNVADCKDEEFAKMMDYLNCVLRIPFGKIKVFSDSHYDIIHRLQAKLDDEFYGMDSVKEQMLVYTCNKLTNPDLKDHSLGLVGPPGTGKTSLTIALAQALDFPFEQLSNISSATSIHGHGFTYVGAQCGDIVKSLIKMDSMNGILFIDEFEKIDMEKTLSSLLQLLDPIQNFNFRDRYVGNIPIDLSQIWFILSMNSLPDNQALSDRIFDIRIPGYTLKEKIVIIKNKVEKMKLDFKLDEDILKYMCDDKSKGIRTPLKMLNALISKIRFLKLYPDMKVTFNKGIIGEFVSLKDVKHIIEEMKKDENQCFGSMYL